MVDKFMVGTFSALNAILSPLAPGVGPAALVQTFDVISESSCQAAPPRSRGPASESPRTVQYSIEVDHAAAESYFELTVLERPCGTKPSRLLMKPTAVINLPLQLLDRQRMLNLPRSFGFVVPGIPVEEGSKQKDPIKLTRLDPPSGKQTERSIERPPEKQREKPAELISISVERFSAESTETMAELKLWIKPESPELLPETPWERIEIGEVRGELRPIMN